MKGKDYPLPSWWSDHDSWRFIDAAKKNREHFHNDMGWHTEWMISMENYNLDNQAVVHIDKGRVYIGPRDKNGIIT